jgi:hypothetical protein
MTCEFFICYIRLTNLCYNIWQYITEWEMHIQYFEIKVCKRRKVLFIKSQFIENVFNKTFFLSHLIEEFLYYLFLPPGVLGFILNDLPIFFNIQYILINTKEGKLMNTLKSPSDFIFIIESSRDLCRIKY